MYIVSLTGDKSHIFNEYWLKSTLCLLFLFEFVILNYTFVALTHYTPRITSVKIAGKKTTKNMILLRKIIVGAFLSIPYSTVCMFNSFKHS